MSLTIKILPVDLEWTVKIALEGSLDTNTSPEFEKKLKSTLPGLDYLILDLSKLSYISSAGVRALIIANKDMAAHGGKVYVTNLQPQIAKVLETVALLPGLHVLGSDEEMDKYLTAIQDEVLKKKGKT